MNWIHYLSRENLAMCNYDGEGKAEQNGSHYGGKSATSQNCTDFAAVDKQNTFNICAHQNKVKCIGR